MTTVYHSGTTVRLQCIFKNFDGMEVDPEIVKLIIYDYRYVKLNEYILSSANKMTTGKYFYDYHTTPGVGERVYYEWYGEIAGNPSSKMGGIRTKFRGW